MLKAIRQRVCILAITAGLSALASVSIFFLVAGEHRFYTDLFFVYAIVVSAFLFGFLAREYRKLETARLIIENKILHIHPAQIDVSTCGDTDTTFPIGGIEVFISCFGILLDYKVIKFNLDGIHLKAVEIGHEFICLTYGTDKQTRKTRILHETIGNQELQSIVERFRYETGVVPVITN